MKVAILLVMLAFVAACKQENDAAKPNEFAARHIRELNTSDTFRFEFPKRKGILDSGLYNDFLQRDQQLGLKSIFQGADSFEIRIHHGGAMIGDRLVILRNKTNNWVAEVSTIVTNVKKGFEKKFHHDWWEKFYLTRTVEYKTPESGWNEFLNQLFQLGILTLPDENDIPGYESPSVMDGCGVSVEVASKNIYRSFGYSDPEMSKSTNSQSKAICDILELIDKELSLVGLEEEVQDAGAWTRKIFGNKPKRAKIQEMKLQDIRLEDSAVQKNKKGR